MTFGNIRTCTPEEFTTWFQVCEAAFGRWASPEEINRWSDIVRHERLLGYCDNSGCVATAGTIGLDMSMPGGLSTHVAGVVMVGVSQPHRSRGIFQELMTQLLRDRRDAGDPLAILWASEGGIYDALQFGLCTLNGTIQANVREIQFREDNSGMDGLQIAILNREQALERLPPIYDQYRTKMVGSISRSSEWWRNVCLPVEAASEPGLTVILLAHREGADKGYAIYRHVPQYDQRLHRDLISVREVVSAIPAVRQRLWRGLFEIRLADQLRADHISPDDPLMLHVRNPGRLRMQIHDGLWCRILDVPTALQARTFSGDRRFVLEVEDPLIETNNGKWLLDIREGNVRVSPTNEDASVKIPVQSLASALLGSFSLVQLASASLVSYSDYEELLRVDTAFRTEGRAWCGDII